jgi:RNA polymerase sigma-70 factor (ECF subfamily)
MTTATTYSGDVFDTGFDFTSSSPIVGGLLGRIWGAAGARSEKSTSAPKLEDEAWISKVLGGDEDAARALIQRLYPTVIKLIRRRLPRRASEEDLAQTVFAKIFSKLDQFSGRVPLEHWVSRIVVNTCFNQLRHDMVRPELRMSDLDCDAEAVVEQLSSTSHDLPGSCRNAARELVEKLLDRLNPDERLVISLLHIEERSVKEICDRTGWSNTLVKVRAFRARRKMRRLWKTLLNGERE